MKYLTGTNIAEILDIGRNRLYEILRSHNILDQDNYRTEPYRGKILCCQKHGFWIPTFSSSLIPEFQLYTREFFPDLDDDF